jgi:hypothetical protein
MYKKHKHTNQPINNLPKDKIDLSYDRLLMKPKECNPNFRSKNDPIFREPQQSANQERKPRQIYI